MDLPVLLFGSFTTDLSFSFCLIAFLALLLDAWIGDPDWIWRKLPHPVVWFGALISFLEKRLFDQPMQSDKEQRTAGIKMLAVLLIVALAVGALIQGFMLSLGLFGILASAFLASIFLAQKSLYQHVHRVWEPLASGNLPKARGAVSMIVGRDPNQLDEAGIARASIESTAENFSDGVVAPLFWLLLLGLPGLFAYKALNTADSMVGHKSERYRHFGRASAKVDDFANFIPSRLSMVLIFLGGWVATKSHSRRNVSKALPMPGQFQMKRDLKKLFLDAGKHRSPSAGWPEGAMAYWLGISLSGPRIYDGAITHEPYVNEAGRKEIGAKEIEGALLILKCSCGVEIALVGLFLILS